MSDNPFISGHEDLPEPPPIVFKYVVPARTDVLENRRIRFTPLTGTNDVFEVRQTFEQIAGPRMKAALSFEADAYKSADIDRLLEDELNKLGLTEPQKNQMRELMGGANLAARVKEQAKTFIEPLANLMNEPSGVARLLDGVFGNIIALSLAEHPDNLLMWAHYAASSTGFIIAFDTSNGFFRLDEEGKSRLQKIRYFDGAVPEIFDDPATVMFSKTTHWAYEHEWRLYRKRNEANVVLENGDDPIHLVDFPPEAVSRIIAGAKASEGTLRILREVLANQYPHAKLTRMHADRKTATLVEFDD